ncbi:MAG: amino acid transporter substrate-binding protein [Frondihabitans sp.]|nr:amino acid transporter substrate-binding protein [Frondihabitans sp.]
MPRNRTKTVAIAAVALVACLALAGCTASSSSATGSSKSTLSDVIKSKTLKVGMVLSLPPMESTNSSGKAVGFDVDLAQELADSLGAKLDVVPLTTDNRIAAVQTGKVDVLFSAPAITLQRAQTVNFTNPYIAAGTALVVKASSGISTEGAMNGKNVGVLKGTIHPQIASSVWPKSAQTNFESATDEITALKNGSVAGFLADGNSAAYYAKKDPSLAVINLPASQAAVEYDGLAIAQGDSTWQTYLNTFLEVGEADGSTKTLYKKWFGSSPAYHPEYWLNK